MTIRIALLVLAGLVTTKFATGKDRSVDEMRAYAEQRIAKAEDEQVTAFVQALDLNDDGTITAAEFARRIEVFQQVFVTIQPIPAGGDHGLPDNWMTDFNQARAKSAEVGKPILVMFSASWCGPCKAMIAHVYPTEDAKNALEAFVPVYIDSEKQIDLASENNIRAYPTFVCFGSEGESIGQHVGGSNVDDFVTMLAGFQETANSKVEIDSQ